VGGALPTPQNLDIFIALIANAHPQIVSADY